MTKSLKFLALMTLGVALFGCERASDPKTDIEAQDQAHRKHIYGIGGRTAPSNLPFSNESKGY